MADELKIPLDPFTDTGLTLLGKVYNSTGSQEGSTVSMSEDGPALYIGDFDVTTRSDGQYIVRFETNTPDKLYGTGSLYIRDGKEVSPEMYFNQSLDTVANVTTVQTTVSNTDMRGTDGANTIAPDNAGIAANGSAIAALNDYDPASDQVIVGTNNDKSGYSLTVSDKNDIVDRNWDEPYNQHTTAGSFGKLMDILRKANRAIEGQVTGTPTTTSFTSNITGYVTGAFDSEILVFVSGTMNGEARPILDYSSTNGTFNFEEAWTQAPSSSDEFVILPYHVHPISEIQEGLSTQASVDTIDSNVDDIKAKTDQLNFTGSDVQSVASNMRGTDGANTVAPDNAGIAANGAAIAALNDISSADVKTQADQALVDYDADTKSHVKPSISI